MTKTNLYSIGTVAIMILAISQQASAQDYSFYNNMFSNMLSNRIWDNIYQQSSPGYSEAKKKLLDSRSRSSGQAPTAPVTPAQMNAAVQFRSTGTRLMTQKFADGLGDMYKQDKTEMKEMISAMVDRYEAEAAAKGLRNDLALALVSYIALNRRVYNGATEKLAHPFEQNTGLRDAIAEYAAQSGTFNKMTDRQKQEMYEALVMVAVFTHYMHELANKSNHAQAQKEIKHIAKGNLKSIGINP
jgi:hypothetical protein